MPTINGKVCVANGRNLLRNSIGKFQPNTSKIDNYVVYFDSTVYMTQDQQYTVHADASPGLVWSGTHDPSVESNRVVLRVVNDADINTIVSDANTGTGTTFTWNNPSGTYYLRVNTYKPDNSGYVENVKIEKGSAATPLTPAPVDKVFSNGVQVYGRNLIQMVNTTAGYVSGNNGTVPPADSIRLERTTDFIEVEPNQTYLMQGEVDLIIGQNIWFGVGVYDSDKAFITRLIVAGNSVTANGTVFQKWQLVIPDNAKYVRASFRTYGNARVKLEKGTTETPWSPAPEDVM